MTDFPISDDLKDLIAAITAAGGRPIIVGGAVRDFLFDGRAPKDVDVEVYGIAIDPLQSVLAECFKVDAVGRSFGVLKVVVSEGTEAFDVSLPRRESKEGSGHKGFITTPDPNMDYAEAAARRDFTINSIGYDPIKSEFLDPYNGQQDLANGVLRATSSHFSEDPLRVLRACQFSARFGFSIEASTLEMCWELNSELSTLPVERLWEEWKKLLLKSDQPSVGIRALKATGALAMFPELVAMLNVPQDPVWHPEGQHDPDGSLWVHNNMVVDEAAKICRRDELDEKESLHVILGSLCHDLGKPSTTEFKDGRWRAHAHDKEGGPFTRSFLGRIGCPPSIIEAVVPLVENHLAPSMFMHDKAGNGAVRRLALKVPLDRLVRVAEADHQGRDTPGVLAGEPYAAGPWLLAKADNLSVREEGPKPFLLGRHLLEIGYAPGKELGVMLKEAFEAQMDDAFSDENEAKEWAVDRFGMAEEISQ